MACAAIGGKLPDDGEDRVLGADAAGRRAVDADLPQPGFFIARHWLASTSRSWRVPMPKASAPSAPCVGV